MLTTRLYPYKQIQIENDILNRLLLLTFKLWRNNENENMILGQERKEEGLILLNEVRRILNLPNKIITLGIHKENDEEKIIVFMFDMDCDGTIYEVFKDEYKNLPYILV